MIDFDRRGYVVRYVFGKGGRAYPKPGAVEARRWAFPYGVSAEGPSMSEAWEAVETMLRARRRLGEIV